MEEGLKSFTQVIVPVQQCKITQLQVKVHLKVYLSKSTEVVSKYQKYLVPVTDKMII